MTIRVRKGTRAAQAAIITEINRMRDALVGSAFHASATRGPAVESDDTVSATALQIVSPAASTLPTSLVRVNEIKGVLNMHFADDGAHNTAVSPAITTPDAIDLATAITLVNAEKAQYNTHRAAASVHHNNDATAEATADATDQASVNTLANALATKINTHMSNALAGWHVKLIDG
jgi:hypothetical protein